MLPVEEVPSVIYGMGGLLICLGQSSPLNLGVELGPRSIYLGGIRAGPIPVPDHDVGCSY